MVRPTGSRVNILDIDYVFEILPEDRLGDFRVDVEGNSENDLGIFPGAVEDFQVDITGDAAFDFLFGDPSGAFRIGNFGADDDIQAEIPNPITLDLIARTSEFEQSGGTFQSLEYSLTGGGLSAFGINELRLIILDSDANDENGFHVLVRNDSGLSQSGPLIEDVDLTEPGVQFGGSTISDLVNPTDDDLQVLIDQNLSIVEIDPVAAVNDISYITGEDERLPESPFFYISQISLVGLSASDASVIISDTSTSVSLGFAENPIIIQAEDLNLVDDIYQVETFDSGDNSFVAIGLSNSSGEGDIDITGQASLIVGSGSDQANISGNYNLTLSTFDENDGAGTIEVLVNGERRGDLITLDENPNSESSLNDVPNEDIRREFTFGLGDIEAGDEIIIQGTSNEGEFTRLDFLSFEEIL